jgi:hypothetical protein
MDLGSVFDLEDLSQDEVKNSTIIVDLDGLLG